MFVEPRKYSPPRNSDDEGKAQQLYRLLLDAMPEGVALTDLAGNITFASPRLLVMYGGATVEDALGTNALQWIAPESREKAERNLRGLANNETSPDNQYILLKKDGTRFVGEISGALLTDEQGHPAGLVTVHRDVTDRQRAVEALRASEERYRMLVDTARDVIFTLAVDGTFTSLNPSFETFTGWTCAEWLGRSFEGLITEEDRPQARDLFQRVLRGEALRAVRLRVQTHAGETLVVELNLSAQIQDSQTRGLLGIARDMTEEQRAADVLTASERRFRALVENSADSIALLDTQGRITYVGPTAGRLLGVNLDDLIGRNSLQDINPDDLAAARNFLAEVTAQPGIPHTTTMRYRNRENGWYWIEATAQNLLAEPGVRSIVVNYRDITARKQAELDSRRQAETMTALYETTHDLVMERDLSQLLRTIVERAAQLLGAAGGGLYLCEPENEQVCCVTSYNTPRDFAGTVLKYGEGAAGLVAQTGEPLIINDYRTWEGRARVYEEEKPFSAVLSVPMKWQNEMIGVIHVLEYGKERHFTEDDQQLVASFADQAAIAVQNARLYTQLQQELAQRRQAEGSLQRSEQVLGLFVEYAPAAIAMLDRNMTYLAASRRYLTDYRLGELKLKGRSHYEVFPETPERWKEIHRRCLAGAIERCEEDSFLRADGTLDWVRWEIRPWNENSGEIGGIILFSEVITEHKQAEALQAAIYQISEAANKAASLNELFPAVQAIVGQVMSARNFYIALYDAGSNQISYPYFIDEVDGSTPALAAKPGRGLTEYTLRTGEPLLCDDALFGELVQDGEVELVGSPSLVWLGVPLLVASQPIGVMALQDYADPQAYGERELRMLEYVSGQVAKAVERTRLHSDLQRRNRILSALQEATLVLMGRLEVNEVLQLILDQAAQLMDTSHGYLYLLDPDETELTARLGSGAFSQYLGRRLKLGEGLSGKIWQTGQPRAVENYHRWPERSTQYDATPFNAVAGVPLTSGSHVIGVLGLAHLDPDRKFGDEEIELLSRFAHLASIALENARLYTLSQQELVERKKAEVALQDNRAQLAGIIQSAMDGVMTIDSDQRIVLFNAASEKIFGCSAAEALGQPIDRFIPVQFRAIHQEHIRRFGQTGVTSRAMGALGELTGLRANGEEFPIEASISQIEVNGQKLYTVIHRDITERKQAEKVQEIIYRISQTAVSAENLAELYQSIHTLLGELMHVENFFIALYDQDKDLLSFPYFVDQYDQPDPLAKLGHGLTGYVLHTGRSLLVSPDRFAQLVQQGEVELLGTNSIDWLGVPLKVGGHVIGAMVTQSYTEAIRFSPKDVELLEVISAQVAQVIERKRAEEALRKARDELEIQVQERTAALSEANALLQTLLDNVLDQIFFKDLNSRFIRNSRSQAKMLGLSDPAEAIGKSDFDFFPHAAQAFADEQEVIRTGQPKVDFEEHVIWPDGRETWVSTTKVPLRDQTGHIIGTFGIARDITDRKRATEALRQAKDELAKANERLTELDRLKSKFVSDVSHELRTPVMNLNLYLNLLERGKPEKRAEYMTVLRQQAARLADLIEDILDLSRVEVGAAQAGFELLDLNAVIASVVVAQRPGAEAKGLALNFAPQVNLPSVRGAANQLTRMMTNLVANAINYTRTGHVTITTRAENDWVLLQVQDTGLGIDPEDLTHLFERFYRGRHAAQSTVPGTGLGLAIVKEIIEAHGGHIDVESQGGAGSTFTVSLPIASGE